METEQAYIISVSVGSGCYRHIRISADAVLFELHQAILDAFGFEDDHAHAFFMDNRLWSEAAGYYSPEIEEETRHTRDYRLKDFGLSAGTKFKYVFDFGEEWSFQCKVLRVLEEPCGKPAVICGVGEAPEQYPEEDAPGDGEDSDEIIFPEIYPPVLLKKLKDGLKLSKATVALLYTYFDAMARLYGILPLRKALEIINSQNTPTVSEKDFTDFAEMVRHEEHYYGIFGKNEILGDNTVSAPLDRELVEESLYAIDSDDYREVAAQQKGKPYYIPPKEELLKYADDGYFEQTRQSRALRDFLRHRHGMTKAKAVEFVEELQLFASDGEMDFQFVMDDMTRMGLKFQNDEELSDFVKLYADLSNHSRMPINRGYTPEELTGMFPAEDRFPKSIEFGPNLQASIKKGAVEAEELRRGIQRMDLPNDLKKDMLAQIDRCAGPAENSKKR